MWKTLGESWIRFLVGRVGADKGAGNIGPGKNKADTLDDGWRMSAAYAATVSLDPAGTGGIDAHDQFDDFHGGN